MNLFKRLFKRNKKEEQKELETMMENANDEGLKTLQKMAFSICLDNEIEKIKNGETDNLNNLIPFFKSKEVEEEVEEEIQEEPSYRKLTNEEEIDLLRRLEASIKEIELENSISNQSEYSESNGRTR